MIQSATALAHSDDAPVPARVRGHLSEKDIKRLVARTQTSTIGPTALYYAGVTAPVISAGMALVTRQMIDSSGLSTYWVVMISSMLAAMAGICWYLIFVRWSDRHSDGRSPERVAETVIDLTEAGLHIHRGEVETRVGWGAIDTVRETRRDTLITFRGAEPLLIPDMWFGKDKTALHAFRARLKEGRNDGPQQEEVRSGRA